MALAAQPQLHFPPQSRAHEPSWDEAIVPALRQRLQNESQMLTKRLSTHSISPSAAAELANATVSAHNSKPSSIPRPSSEAPAKKRQRTNSTPYSSIPVPVATTRIPKVASSTASKNGSISSHGHPYRPSNLSTSVNGSVSRGVGSKATNKSKEYMEPPSPASFSENGSYRRNVTSKSYIPNEEAPFPNSASTSTEFHYEQTRLMQSSAIHAVRHGRYATAGSSFDGSARPSIDEEGDTSTWANGGANGDAGDASRKNKRESGGERPFEHWYRGEAARNGGVGELKIGKAEMLDIAQFGYARGGVPDDVRKQAGTGVYSTIGSGSVAAALRRRAGSFDGKRESWIIPADMVEGAYGSKVIDESPLTDLEGDEYTTEGERNYPYPATAVYPYGGRVNGASTSAVGGASAGDPRHDGMDYTYEEEADTTITMSTTPTGISSIPAGPYSSRRGTVTNGAAGAGQIPRPIANGRLPSTGSTVGGKTPLGTNNGATPSPSSAAATAAKAALLGKPAGKNKKGKAVTKQRSRTLGSAEQAAIEAELQLRQRQQDENDDVEKIPFRKPPAKGNWDDIVLPAVTKKMGIEGYGLKSEGGNILEISEEVRKRMSAINPPVPGLFGYDLSKYRPARPEEDIHMAELGVSEPSPPGTPKANTKAALPPPSGRESPLAFSHYQDNLPPPTEKNARRKSAGVPAIMVSPPSAEEHARLRKEMEDEEKKGKGCCGCVVM